MTETLNTHENGNYANRVLALVNTWTNQFGDRIMFVSSFLGKNYMERNYSISIDGKYLKTVGSVNIGKAMINKHRNIKCTWVGTSE